MSVVDIESQGEAVDSRSDSSNELLIPRQVPGTTLLGRYDSAGLKDDRYLIRRPDGQMVLVSALLYMIVSKCDGERTLHDVADEVRLRDLWTLARSLLARRSLVHFLCERSGHVPALLDRRRDRLRGREHGRLEVRWRRLGRFNWVPVLHWSHGTNLAVWPLMMGQFPYERWLIPHD